jgi:hypothetical protein
MAIEKELSRDDEQYALGYKSATSDMLGMLESVKFDIIVEEKNDTFSKIKGEIIDEVIAKMSEIAVDNYYDLIEALHEDYTEEKKDNLAENEEMPS